MGPGSILFHASNELHTVKNVGTTDATYPARFFGEGAPLAAGQRNLGAGSGDGGLGGVAFRPDPTGLEQSASRPAYRAVERRGPWFASEAEDVLSQREPRGNRLNQPTRSDCFADGILDRQ